MSDDPVADLLRSLNTSDRARAAAWDAVYSVKDDAGAEQLLRQLPFSDDVRAKLWDARQGDTVQPMNFDRPPLQAESPTWAQRGGYGPRGTAIVDAAEGATAGLMNTMFQTGDLIRRGTGMERVINAPEAQQAMRAPASIPGKVGYLGEQAAEFAVPLSKVNKAVRGANVVARMAAEGAAGAATAGAQSGGDPVQMAIGGAGGALLPAAGAAGRAVQRAAAGAEEGGVGGAIAGAVRATSPVEPKAAMIQALKPRAMNRGFAQGLDRALPEIKAAESELGKPIESLDDLMKATDIAKKRVRAQYDAYAGPQRAMGSTVDLTPVADAMEQSIPSKVRLENVGKADAITQRADIYRKRFPIADAEQLLKETNADLESFYAKYPAAQRRALAADPEVAQLEAQARALRTAIYTTLDAPGQGSAARELQRRYGALMDIEQEAARRANVAARQQPESLSEQIGKTRAAVDYAKGTWRLLHGDVSGMADIAGAHAGRATSTYLKEQQTTDALIRRAMAGFRGEPVPVPAPVQRPVRGLLDRGAIRADAGADPSFVRGVPAARAQSERPALPAGRPPIVTPQRENSGVHGVPAKSVVQRDPRTGRMRRVYTSEAK